MRARHGPQVPGRVPTRVYLRPGRSLWAAWCGPCRAFGPVYEKAAERHPDIVSGKVDTEAQPGLAGDFRISSIPR
ncbi:thioredoxin family protein [Streptomyces sviceus]|uniref:thioredoxin family protein n=1 Tax=Streptomyces sviceus TaxID=285530 RepID=UPI00381C01E6